jgi:hypothetical protein
MKAFLQVFASRTIVFILIILLIIAMVVVTIMRDRILQLLGIINPWYEQKALENQCRERCSSWCTRHIGEPGTGWENIDLVLPRGEIKCEEVMFEALGDNMGNCTCGYNTSSL